MRKKGTFQKDKKHSIWVQHEAIKLGGHLSQALRCRLVLGRLKTLLSVEGCSCYALIFKQVYFLKSQAFPSYKHFAFLLKNDSGNKKAFKIFAALTLKFDTSEALKKHFLWSFKQRFTDTLYQFLGKTVAFYLYFYPRYSHNSQCKRYYYTPVTNKKRGIWRTQVNGRRSQYWERTRNHLPSILTAEQRLWVFTLPSTYIAKPPHHSCALCWWHSDVYVLIHIT